MPPEPTVGTEYTWGRDPDDPTLPEVSTIPIVVQPACADLPRLRALRDAVLRDPTLREAITTSGRSVGVGFSIDTEAMRLRMLFEGSLASPKLVEHLENTFGVDNLDVRTITLLSGDPG